MSDWKNVPEDLEEWIGFVYLITSPSGKKYVGKKVLRNQIRRKALKGKKRIRKDTRESNWKSYWGSCNELLMELQRAGREGWSREILSLHKGKWELQIAEAKEILNRDALYRTDYFNAGLRTHLRKAPKHLLITPSVRIRKRS